MVQDLSMFLRLFRFLRGQRKTEVRSDLSPGIARQQTYRGALLQREARYAIGDVLRHRIHPFRGVVFDIDPEFSNTEEWYESIPKEMRPRRDQPYYHLFAENDTSHYVAYVSEQNLVPDDNIDPVSHPDIIDVFDYSEAGYALKQSHSN
jgi:heat shock protein HspQ